MCYMVLQCTTWGWRYKKNNMNHAQSKLSAKCSSSLWRKVSQYSDNHLDHLERNEVRVLGKFVGSVVWCYGVFCGKMKQYLKKRFKRLGRLGNETLWNMSTGGEVSTSTSGEWRVKGGPGRPSGLRRQVKFHKVTKKTTVPKTQCDLHMNYEILWNEMKLMRWNHQWPKKILTNIQSIVNFTYYYEL